MNNFKNLEISRYCCSQMRQQKNDNICNENNHHAPTMCFFGSVVSNQILEILIQKCRTMIQLVPGLKSRVSLNRRCQAKINRIKIVNLIFGLGDWILLNRRY